MSVAIDQYDVGLGLDQAMRELIERAEMNELDTQTLVSTSTHSQMLRQAVIPPISCVATKVIIHLAKYERPAKRNGRSRSQLTRDSSARQWPRCFPVLVPGHVAMQLDGMPCSGLGRRCNMSAQSLQRGKTGMSGSSTFLCRRAESPETWAAAFKDLSLDLRPTKRTHVLPDALFPAMQDQLLHLQDFAGSRQQFVACPGQRAPQRHGELWHTDIPGQCTSDIGSLAASCVRARDPESGTGST